MKLRERYRMRLRDHAKAAALLDQLFLNPFVTVARAARLLKASNPTARKAVARLEKIGMLEEISGREWGRVYLARPILRIIERPSPPAK